MDKQALVLEQKRQKELEMKELYKLELKKKQEEQLQISRLLEEKQKAFKRIL